MPAPMASDVVSGGEFRIAGNSKGPCVLLSLRVVDIDPLFLIIAVPDGRHQVVQHVHVGSIGAGGFSL